MPQQVPDQNVVVLVDLDDNEKRQVLADQLRDGDVIWRRQFEDIDVTWLAYSLRRPRFASDEQRRSFHLNFYTDAQRSEPAIEFVSAKYHL